jgi:hypothetical protein
MNNKVVIDVTETVRRAMVTEINSEATERAALEAKYGQVWNTEELRSDFTVRSFMAPFVMVVRKSDNFNGSLTFQHNPRYYFDFVAY